MLIKKCTKCLEEKEIIFFDKCLSKKSGLHSHCKICRKQYAMENAEQIALKQKEYRLENIENIKLSKKEYYSSNSDTIKANVNEYRINNHTKVLDRKKKYRSDNKVKILSYMKIYSKTPMGIAVKRNVTNSRRLSIKHSENKASSLELKLLSDTAKKCYWCDNKIIDKKYHIDHYIPLKTGGSHSMDNIVISCPSCNIKKGAKDPIVFAQSIGKLL